MMNSKMFLIAAILTATAMLFTCEKVPDYCGTGELYDPNCEFCFGSRAYPMCSGGADYNPLTGGCDQNNRVGTRCSDETVVPSGTPCGGYTLTVAAAPETGGTLAPTTPPKGPTYVAGEDVVLIANSKSEYEFAGWAGAQPSKGYSAGNMTTATYTMKGVMPQVTIVAMFKPTVKGKLITDAFPEHGGEVTRNPDKEIYGFGENVTVTAIPKSGYTFAGWSGIAGADASKNSVTIKMDDGKTLVAMFTPVVHTLKTIVNPTDGGAIFINGTALTGNASQDVETYIAVLAREAEGYRFTGWTGSSVEIDNRNSLSTTVTLNANATITANFVRGNSIGTGVTQAVVCTLTVNKNPAGGTVTLRPDLEIYKIGTNVTATATPEAGHIFTGWSGSATTYMTDSTRSPAAIKTMKSRLTLSANFWNLGDGPTPPQKQTYTITFNANGGSVTPTSGTTNTSGYLTSLPTPTRSDYTFNGWYTSSSGGSRVTTDTKFYGNTTIYAQWTYNTPSTTTYTITFDANGGTFSSGATSTTLSTGTSGRLSSLPSNPTRSGYTFKGWYTSTTGDTKITMDYTFYSNTTVYAQWTYIPVNPPSDGDYESVEIGGMRWMKKNLNIETADSWCYEYSADNCAKYGRLYKWNAAKTACPKGWHLPSRDEWGALAKAAGGTGDYGAGGKAGKALKSKNGWYNNVNGTDDYGFSALPGGSYSGGYFNSAGYYGHWWTATEYGSGSAYRRYIYYDNGYDYVGEYYDDKSNGLSVRCVAGD